MRRGAGVKNKVLEAWAAGLPVVMTPIATNGFSLDAEKVYRALQEAQRHDKAKSNILKISRYEGLSDRTPLLGRTRIQLVLRILDDYPSMRHRVNLETVRTDEGTHDVQTLILGGHITGMRA